MLFNSINFLIFFPAVVLLYFIIPYKFRNIWLLAASYFFYMSWNVKYVFLLIFSTAVTYACARLIDISEEKNRKKIWASVGFILNLSILFFFKYFNFLIESINQILEKTGFRVIQVTFDVVLPVGISFYIFQALGYMVDVYRGGKCEKNFLRYALFVSFFPQLVAGPIERSGNLLKQLEEKHRYSFQAMREGLLLMLWGYFLKLVIADRAAVLVNTVYGDIGKYNGWYLIVAGVLFAFQIYGDFAGYSTIAAGAAKVMGFELMDNFNAPYYSRSVGEFWRRWHISLSSWFRDYLYIPLGGNRKGTVRKYMNLMAVFSVSGLWHGAAWTFLLWGGVNGAYQIIGSLLQPVRNRLAAVFKIKRDAFSHQLLKCAVTFILVDLSWVLFRAVDITEAITIFKSIFHAENLWILLDGSLYQLGLNQKNYQLLCLAIIVLMAADWMKYRGICIREFIFRQELWFRWLVYIGAVVGILVFGVWGYGYDAGNFIYFQF